MGCSRSRQFGISSVCRHFGNETRCSKLSFSTQHIIPILKHEHVTAEFENIHCRSQSFEFHQFRACTCNEEVPNNAAKIVKKPKDVLQNCGLDVLNRMTHTVEKMI